MDTYLKHVTSNETEASRHIQPESSSDKVLSLVPSAQTGWNGTSAWYRMERWVGRKLQTRSDSCHWWRKSKEAGLPHFRGIPICGIETAECSCIYGSRFLWALHGGHCAAVLFLSITLRSLLHIPRSSSASPIPFK